MEKKSKDLQLRRYYKGKKIIITGANGFKGVWLSLILKSFGAKVFGIGIKDKSFFLFKYLKLNQSIDFKYLNINNKSNLERHINQINPDIIFHLASESLVINCNKNPLKAFNTNLIGLAKLLDIIKTKKTKKKLIINIVTSDKCYLPQGKKKYLEGDKIGGIDIYSASKSCQEIITKSYYESFLKRRKLIITTFRAGNVIGGGDYAKNRLFPDLSKIINNNKVISIRNPKSTRPWQHVLDCIRGYLLTSKFCDLKNISFSSWNFSPSYRSMTVKEVINLLIDKKIINEKQVRFRKNFVKESLYLNLDSRKVKKYVGFKSKFSFKMAVTETILLYLKIDKYKKNHFLLSKSINDQINKFFN